MARRAKTPAQRQRNKFVEAVRARGGSGHNLWFIHPPLDPDEDPLILGSDLELDALLYLEGSPDLVEIDYSCLRHSELPRAGRRVFATARTIEDHEIEVILAPEGAASDHPSVRVIDLSSLAEGKTRIQSWRAIVGALNRCRLHTLDPVIIRCRRIIEHNPGVSLNEVFRQVSEHHALVVGAIGMMLRTREVVSDLDKKLWGPNTTLMQSP